MISGAKLPVRRSDPLAGHRVTALLHALHQVVTLRLLDLSIANRGTNGGTNDGTCQRFVVAFNCTAQGTTCADYGCSLADMPLPNATGLGAALSLIIGITTWQSTADLQRCLQRDSVAGG